MGKKIADVPYMIKMWDKNRILMIRLPFLQAVTRKSTGDVLTAAIHGLQAPKPDTKAQANAHAMSQTK